MKKNINILIESIIKNVIRDINKNYVIIEELDPSGIMDAGQEFKDARTDDGVNSITSFNVSEDFSEAVIALIGATAVTTGENAIPPTAPLTKTIASGTAGALYMIAGHYFLKLSKQQPAGSELRSYNKWQGIIYYIIGAVSLGFTISGAAGLLKSSLPVKPEDVANVATFTHRLSRAASSLEVLVTPEAIKEMATAAVNKQTLLKTMDFNLKKLDDISNHIFFIGDSIAFREINGKNYIVLPNTPASQSIKTDIDDIASGHLPSDDNLVEVDIDAFKNDSIVDNNNLKSDVVIIPVDKIRFKDMDVGKQSTMYAEMRSANIDFSTDVNTARIANAKDGYLNDLDEASMQLGKLEKSLSSLSGFTNEELLAIAEELESFTGGDRLFAGINLTQDEINTFLSGVSNPTTRTRIESSLTELRNKADNMKQTGANINTADATGGPRRKSEGSEVECSKIGLNRLDDSRSLLNNRGLVFVNAKRNKNIIKLTNNLQTGQTKIANSLKAEPIKMEFNLMSVDQKVIYEGELVIFAYRSPGVFIGALSFKKEIQNLEAILANNLDEAVRLQREMGKSRHNQYATINPDNLESKIGLPANSGKGAKLPTDADPGWADFMANHTDYNNIINDNIDLEKEISSLKSLGTNKNEPGIIPMAFDMDGHPDLRAKAKDTLGDEEFNSLLALRKELKLSKKESAWYTLYLKSAALGFYNNSNLIGVALTATNAAIHSAEHGWHTWLGEDVSINAQEVNTGDEIIEVIPSETPGLKVVRDLGLEEYYSDKEK